MLRAEVHFAWPQVGEKGRHDPPGGGARDVRAAALAERRCMLINSGTIRTSTVRALLRGAPFDARSPVPCLLDARIDPQAAG